MFSQKILMCPPDHYGVDYVINPWMENNKGRTQLEKAQGQWSVLKNRLASNASIEIIPAEPHLPDMVFTANAGLVLGKTAVVSRFVSKERQGEEPFFKAWFEKNGFTVASWPQEISFEGAGDSLFDRAQPILWQGYGFRSDERSVPLLEKILGCRVIGLHLVDPHFYHLDTCFCPLPDGWLLYYPEAFTPEARALIEAEVPPEKRIVAGEGDAHAFACNMAEIEGRVFMNSASTILQDQLRMAGFTPNLTPMSEFMMAGGGCKCLTLKLVESLAGA